MNQFNNKAISQLDLRGFMFPAVFNLNNLNGQNGFALNGISGGSGGSVSTAGDVNYDGIADIIIGAPYANNGTGQSYVMFGEKYAVNSPGNSGAELSGSAQDNLEQI